MKRRKPLKRSWFKARGPSWRSEPEYREAVLRAFLPYTRGDSVRCIFCGRYYSEEDITPCHIRAVGSNYELRAEVKNIVPACFTCHGKYELKTNERKARMIEDKIPSRWAELEALKRRCYAEVSK